MILPKEGSERITSRFRPIMHSHRKRLFAKKTGPLVLREILKVEWP